MHLSSASPMGRGDPGLMWGNTGTLCGLCKQISALVVGEMRRQHARLTEILETFPRVFYFSKLLINEKRGNCNKAPLPSRISILLINFVLFKSSFI